ncbi:hypothetical protein MMC30_002997 [Trapelia coarctata]|nr:hypothetical protein [Trapelia coarctata]
MSDYGNDDAASLGVFNHAQDDEEGYLLDAADIRRMQSELEEAEDLANEDLWKSLEATAAGHQGRVTNSESQLRIKTYINNIPPSHSRQCAEGIINHPDRTVHADVSNMACDRCRRDEYECVTAPGQQQCAYCVIVSQELCKAAEDRMAERGDQELRTLGEYFDTRAQNSRHITRARAFLNSPTRVVYQSTDESACVQCRQRGFPCVTLPGMTHCVFCTSMGSGKSYYCSTANERMGREERGESDERCVGG